MKDVVIAGIGHTMIGELWSRSYRSLIVEAGLMAMEDAKISGADIDSMYISTMSGGKFISQENIGALVADAAGLAKRYHTPAIRVEGADASGALALRQGFLAVASGLSKAVVVGGVEKMTDVTYEQAMDTMATGADQEWEVFFGATLASTYALMASKHMNDHGTTREQIAKVAVKNHEHGSRNPYAQYKNKITVEKVLGSEKVADPLRQLDCTYVADGAAALVLCSEDMLTDTSVPHIKITGSGLASDTIALHNRRDICTMDATVHAAKKAYEMANKTSADISVAEVHDSFTIGEIIASEDLGFFEKGKGGQALDANETTLNGRIPINTSGGLKARGNPLGATGILQAIEIVEQLRGTAGERQVANASVGLTHSVGGSGGSSAVHIYEVMS